MKATESVMGISQNADYYGLQNYKGGIIEAKNVTGTGNYYGLANVDTSKITATNIYYCKTKSIQGTLNVTPKCASGCTCAN